MNDDNLVPEDDDLDDEIDADDDDLYDVVEMIFSPRTESLASFGISTEAFEEALVKALEARQQLDDEAVMSDDLAPISEMELEIEGRRFKLEDLADIEIGGDLDSLGDDDDDFDDEDEEDENDG